MNGKKIYLVNSNRETFNELNSFNECSKRKCKHVFKSDESVFKPIKNQTALNEKELTCPKCGNNEYYRIRYENELKNS